MSSKSRRPSLLLLVLIDGIDGNQRSLSKSFSITNHNSQFMRRDTRLIGDQCNRYNRPKEERESTLGNHLKISNEKSLHVVLMTVDDCKWIVSIFNLFQKLPAADTSVEYVQWNEIDQLIN